MSSVIKLDGRPVSLADLRSAMAAKGGVALSDNVKAGIGRAQATVAEIVRADKTVYGINTGFGLLAQTSIPKDRLEILQKNLVLSHSAGLGAPLPDNVVRLTLILKIISLSQGYSGVRLKVIGALNALLEREIYPVIPEKGSVGASGDLAPLAHMTAATMGEGHVRIKGQILPALEGLKTAGLEPLVLGPKEGLALLNGTQVSTALALHGLFQIENIFDAAAVAGAMSVDAMKGSDAPFDPRIHAARGQPGQIVMADCYQRLLSGSAIRQSHLDCEHVQDPYSLRCQPQVMGAVLDLLTNASQTLRIEANGATDNPLVFAAEGEVISGGNFHAEPVAFAADILAMAVAEIGSLSERRTALLVDPHMSGLPAFLVRESGLNSGFMIPQVTAAALVSENKTLAHPASVDSIPTSANQEDHVSMATFAARRLTDMAENAAGVVAIELLAAAQGIEFHRPLKSSAPIEEAHAQIREKVPPYDQDRFFAPDMTAIRNLVLGGAFRGCTDNYLPSA